MDEILTELWVAARNDYHGWDVEEAIIAKESDVKIAKAALQKHLLKEALECLPKHKTFPTDTKEEWHYREAWNTVLDQTTTNLKEKWSDK